MKSFITDNKSGQHKRVYVIIFSLIVYMFFRFEVTAIPAA